ncbi:unnamed protein product [Nippostrongylus brasiliensis]|uniref:Vacuolar fusion protein MON1 homolog n=1 Tax=Nippostrongylus brasiliensis TaxID=27835 RepID=A0A0N4YHM2_NIPBR|nr:unnamed protein product [Nippostrongylus brasiliensis]
MSFPGGKSSFSRQCGHEDQLCSLFALIGVFVSRVKLWGDRLLEFSSGDVHVRFCHRSSLILCIVSRSYELLDEQLNVLFDQIVSTLSRSQLDVVYKKKGDNYDLRRLLRGTDKYIDGSVSAWRSDISLLQTAIRVLPMQPTDRDYLSSTIVSCITAAKLDGVLFGIVLAYRQVAALVRLRRYSLHPRDVHILLNLISGNSSLQITEAQTWTPICLPNFNDKGFVYAYISFPWENSPACLILISVKKEHFDPLNEVKKKIVEKLESNTKFFPSFQSSVESPVAFDISQIGTSSDVLWSFVYKNKFSRQICVSGAKIPLISRQERAAARCLYERITHLSREESHMRCLFLKRSRENILVWVSQPPFTSSFFIDVKTSEAVKGRVLLFGLLQVTDKFELQCIFSPLVSAVVATAAVNRLLKTLKYHEQRYFIIHTPSF